MAHIHEAPIPDDFERLSELIASGLPAEQLLAQMAQRIAQLLAVGEVQIFLRRGQEFSRQAAYPSATPALGEVPLAATDEIERWVATHGHPLVMEPGINARRAAAASDLSTTLNTTSKAAVPIWAGRQVIGILSIADEFAAAVALASPEPPAQPAALHPPSGSTSLQSLVPLLEVFADVIFLTLEHRRLLTREDRRLRLLQLFLALATPAVEMRVAELAQRLADEVSVLVEEAAVSVWLHSAETDELLALGVSATPLGQRQHDLGLDHLALGTAGSLADVFRTGQPRLVKDPEALSHLPTTLRELLGLQVAALVAIEVAGTPQGVVFVSSTNPEALTEEDLLLLQLISARFGGLLQRQAWSAELAQVEADRLAQVERDDFLSSVAHDLKNALTMIRGNAQLAVRRAAKGDTGGTEVVFTRIATKAGQAIQLVNDLLDVSHLEIGMFRLVMEPVEVVAWLEEEVAALQATFAEQATITFQTDYAQVAIEADPNRLSQVLSNLVTNAVRYAPQSSLIEVCLTQAPPPARWPQPAEAGTLPQAIQIIVNDQGLGVAPEEQERIFERATRGRGARLAPGSGLGLYISREIIHRHGGQIWVQGRDGPGASFRFTLPLSRTHPQAEATPPDA